jgi:hypothetical protein
VKRASGGGLQGVSLTSDQFTGHGFDFCNCKHDASQLSYLAGYISALPPHTEYFFTLWMGDKG